MQDFLRSLLHPDWHDLQKVVFRLSQLAQAPWRELERSVLAGEWQTERARQLGARDQELYKALHIRFEQAVGKWIMDAREMTVWSEVRSMLRDRLSVFWAIGSKPAEYFDKTYALNRVLGIVLLKYVNANPGDPKVFIKRKNLTSVNTLADGSFAAELKTEPGAVVKEDVLRRLCHRSTRH